MVKQSAREQIVDRLTNMPKDQLEQKSCFACQKLCDIVEFEDAAVVMMFLSLPEEVDTASAIEYAFQQGKTVLVPLVDWEKRCLVPVILDSLDCKMAHTRYGLRHPARTEPVSICSIDMIVVPGLGFDEHGNRLGRGGGYYDRLLSQDGFQGVVCGLGLEEQVLDHVPVMEHDVRLDMLVTDRHIRRFANE